MGMKGVLAEGARRDRLNSGVIRARETRRRNHSGGCLGTPKEAETQQ